MVVTTTSSTAASPSTVMPRGISSPSPKAAHSTAAWWGLSPPITPNRIVRLMTQPTATARMPTGAPPSGRRLPTSRMTTQAARGRAGTSQASSFIGLLSPAQQVDLVDVDRLAVAEDQQHDRQADADLGGGHGDHEQREHLAGDELVPQVGAERDQVDVHRVEHQLDAHQHHHRVAPGERGLLSSPRRPTGALVSMMPNRISTTIAPT